MAAEHVSYTVGPAGSGKSLTRCAYYLADEWLPYESGPIITNFPINVEAMAEFVARKHKKDPAEIAARIRFIPESVLKGWASEEIGPDDYFGGMPLGGALIAIDEAHNFLGRKHSAEHRRKWSQFCGEIRHRGASIEFLTQDESKIAGEVEYESLVKRSVSASEHRRDPYFSIKMADWYELFGAFTGEYSNKVILEEQRKSAGGRWKTELTTVYLHRPEYYGLYDSVNLPHGEGGEVKIEKPLHLFNKLSKAGVVGWFVRRNWFSLSTRLVIASVLMWLTLGGGTSVLAGQLLKRFSQVAGKAAAKSGQNQAKPSSVAVASVPNESQVIKPSSVPSPSNELLELRGLVEKLSFEMETVRRSQREETSVIAIIEDSAVLRSGEIVKAGDYLDVEQGVRERVRQVDFDSGRVILASGRVLGIDRSIGESERASHSSMGEGTGAFGGLFSSGGVSGKKDFRDGSGSSDEGFRPHPRPENGSPDSNRRVVRPSPRDTRNQESGPRRSPVNRRSPVRVRGDESGGDLVPGHAPGGGSGYDGTEDSSS